MQEVLHRIAFLCLNYIYSMIQKKHRYIKSIIISLISFLILIIASTYYLLLTWSIDCNFTDKIVIPRGVSLNKTISILKANSCFEEGTPLKILMIIKIYQIFHYFLISYLVLINIIILIYFNIF